MVRKSDNCFDWSTQDIQSKDDVASWIHARKFVLPIDSTCPLVHCAAYKFMACVYKNMVDYDAVEYRFNRGSRALGSSVYKDGMRSYLDSAQMKVFKQQCSSMQRRIDMASFKGPFFLPQNEREDMEDDLRSYKLKFCNVEYLKTFSTKHHVFLGNCASDGANVLAGAMELAKIWGLLEGSTRLKTKEDTLEDIVILNMETRLRLGICLFM